MKHLITKTKIKIKNGRQRLEASGSAMVLTMFILAGMLIVAMSGAHIILLGINASGTQAQSTRAYFAAEAGVEYILWDIRHNGGNYGAAELDSEIVPETALQTADANYTVYKTGNNHSYTSVGNFFRVKRSVEVSF